MARISQRVKVRHQDNVHRWLVSYADYMTLMFAFFVVLYAMSIVKEQSFDVLSDSLGEIFHIKGDRGTGTRGDGVLTQQVIQHSLLEGNAFKPNKGPDVSKQEIVINESDQKKLGNPLEALKQDLHSALYELTEAGYAKLEKNNDWLTIELSGNLLFASGSATTNPAAIPVIEEVATILVKVNNFIKVRGYTDNLTINNEIYNSNWELSAARAAAVTDLLQRFGIVRQRLAIEANGENLPIADNNTESGRARNRRVVIALSKYAYKADEMAADIIEQEADVTKELDTVLPKDKEIRVIRLPNGGVRVTTRTEDQQDTTKKDDIDNN